MLLVSDCTLDRHSSSSSGKEAQAQGASNSTYELETAQTAAIEDWLGRRREKAPLGRSILIDSSVSPLGVKDKAGVSAAKHGFQTATVLVRCLVVNISESSATVYLDSIEADPPCGFGCGFSELVVLKMVAPSSWKVTSVKTMGVSDCEECNEPHKKLELPFFDGDKTRRR